MESFTPGRKGKMVAPCRSPQFVYQKRSDLVNRLVDGSVNIGQSKRDQKREINKTHGQFSKELKVLEPVFFFFEADLFFSGYFGGRTFCSLLHFLLFWQDSPTWRNED